MANMDDLNDIVADNRELFLENWDSPKVAAVQAFDVITTLLTSAVCELRAIREQLESRPNA